MKRRSALREPPFPLDEHRQPVDEVPKTPGSRGRISSGRSPVVRRHLFGQARVQFVAGRSPLMAQPWNLFRLCRTGGRAHSSRFMRLQTDLIDDVAVKRSLAPG